MLCTVASLLLLGLENLGLATVTPLPVGWFLTVEVVEEVDDK